MKCINFLLVTFREHAIKRTLLSRVPERFSNVRTRYLYRLEIPSEEWDKRRTDVPEARQTSQLYDYPGLRYSAPIRPVFVLPDLVNHCPFSPTYHDDGDAIAADSLEWIVSQSPHFTQKQVTAMRGLQAGELTAYCYNNCASDHLRVVSDFMYYLFHLDDISDGHLARDAEGLGNCVMNAFEWPDDYRPVRGQQGGIQVQEISAAKLARE